jgi:hypothetical protein
MHTLFLEWFYLQKNNAKGGAWIVDNLLLFFRFGKKMPAKLQVREKMWPLS